MFEHLIERYIDAAEDYTNALKKGNHIAANAAHRVIQGAFEKLNELGRGGAIIPLLEDSRLAIRYCAAVDALSIAPERGEAVLEAIVSGPPSPIRLMAQVSLNEWRKRGRG